MATEAERTSLRGMLGESIPPGGAASDTLVSDDQLDTWITDLPSLNHAAAAGWQFKLAHWAGLVDVVDGASARNLSDLMDHAKYMVDYYHDLTMGLARSRSRVGKIIRR